MCLKGRVCALRSVRPDAHARVNTHTRVRKHSRTHTRACARAQDKLQRGLEQYSEKQGKGFVCWRFLMTRSSVGDQGESDEGAARGDNEGGAEETGGE